ncbi:MAG: hypothetical protein ACD_26C00004G0001 [uncultured bacterium]|nr:MAG: hypothetical protein ACD_26C00004G0001 [uncultured bacterium]
MIITYRVVFVYVDKKDNLLIIPTGESEKYGTMGLDLFYQLDSPYSNDELEKTLHEALDMCCSKKPQDDTTESSIERHLKVKGFSKAVKDKKLVSVNWNIDDGFYVTPTQKIPKKGYVHMNDIILGKELEYGALTKALKFAILSSSS